MREDFAGQARDPYPGQNQKAAVVDNILQVAGSLLSAPTNPAVADGHLPGRGGPQHAGQHLIATGGRANQVTQVSAKGNSVPQVVVELDQLLPQAALGRIGRHQFELQRFELAR